MILNILQKGQVVRNKWRIPNIMELSSLFHKYTFPNYEHIWTCTPVRFMSDKPKASTSHYWTGSKPTDQSTVYRMTAYNEYIVCMLVKTEGAFLKWSNQQKDCSFKDAEEICQLLSDSLEVKYTSERRCHEE